MTVAKAPKAKTHAPTPAAVPEAVIAGRPRGRYDEILALQRTAGNRAVNESLHRRDTASMPLEEAIRNIPHLSQGDALDVLKRFQTVVRVRISSGEARINRLQSQRAESFSNYLIGGAIEVFGSTSLPSADWTESSRHLDDSFETIHSGQVKESLNHLLAAAKATDEEWTRLNAYLEKTEAGADRSIFVLQALEAAGAVAATALTGGGAAAVAVGAGYAATQNLMGQVTSVSIGVQNQIDCGGLAFDTLFGLLTGALGGKLGNAVLNKLLGNRTVASLGRHILAEVVSDLVSGRLSSILQTAAHSRFDQLRGRENLTMEQFIERLAEQLMDPKSMFLDAIIGRASRMAHAPSSKSLEKAAATAHARRPEPVGKTPVPALEPAYPTPAKAPHELAPTRGPKESAPSTVTEEPPVHPSSGSPEPSGLELDLSGSREGWNRHIEEYQVRETTTLSVDTKKPTFGEASTEKGGTEYHTGMHFHEYSAAEVAIGLRVDWDPQAGRPRSVSYNFTAESPNLNRISCFTLSSIAV